MRRPACLIVLALLGAAFPSSALARANQEMILQEDPQVVFPRSDTQLKSTLREIKELGTDRLRVTVLWNLVAPAARSERRPSFGAHGPADPRSYPDSNWRRYDRIVQLANELGLKLLFTVSGPGPAWADQGHGGRAGIRRPNVAAFRDFTEAVGRRYPTVDHWSIWNEPNFPGWLMPQWRGRRPVSPHLYRGLVDAAWDGLAKSGHGADTILLGETARFAQLPKRARIVSASLVDTLRFVRELYCVSGRYRPLRGRGARARGCPATAAGRTRFKADHPGLFRAPGWAHHPYTITRFPAWKGHGPTDTVIGSIGRLGRALDRARRPWRSFRRLPLWITEFGYQTRPDPFRSVPYSHQAAWLSWGEYLAFRSRRIASFAQFLLEDDAPLPSGSIVHRWVTWQSGLRTHSGDAKPALAEYRHPIFVTPRRARVVRVFGAFRPAADDAVVPAQIEFRGRSGVWQTLRGLTAAGPRAYVNARVRLPGAGRVRITFAPPGSAKRVATRSVAVARR